MDILKKIIKETIDKNILFEGLSERLFHFCPLNSLYSIVKNNQFKLTSITKNKSDKLLTSLPINANERKQYNYYMCFSITPSSLVGYVSMRRDNTGGFNWKQSLVRIEVDGTKLQSRYKGMPVNYFQNKYDSKIKSNYNNINVNSLTPDGKIKPKYLKKYNPHISDNITDKRKRRNVGVDYYALERNQMSEYEDRLFSNQEYINNALTYIKRIDIYLNENILNLKNNYSYDLIFMVNEIIKKCGDIVHIYDNFSSFESMNIVNSIEGQSFILKRFKEKNLNDYIEKYEHITKDSLNLQLSELKTIIQYLIILGFSGLYNNWESDLYNCILYSLSYLKIKIPNNFEIELDNFINRELNAIITLKGSYFLYKTSMFIKQLESIPHYRYNEYIKPLDERRKNQEKIYSEKYGKHINITTIKSNFFK